MYVAGTANGVRAADELAPVAAQPARLVAATAAVEVPKKRRLSMMSPCMSQT
jgi:hypothetical protein